MQDKKSAKNEWMKLTVNTMQACVDDNKVTVISKQSG